MKTGAPITMNFETFPGDEYWSDTGKVRDMSPRAQDVWEQRREAICRAEAGIDWVNSHLRLYHAHVPVNGLPSYSVAEQVAKSIERLAGSEAGLQSWAVY